MLDTHASIREIDEAIARGEATLAEARRLLNTRKGRKGVSGKNARQWLSAHQVSREAAAAKATLAKATPPAPAPVRELKHGRTRDGRPVSEVAWKLRGELRKRGIERTYAECIASVQRTLG